MLSLAVSAAVMAAANWTMVQTDIVCGDQRSSPHVWVAATGVSSAMACQQLCAANMSCNSFDWATGRQTAAEYSPVHGEPRSHYYTDYANDGGCGDAGKCFFRNDDWFPSNTQGGKCAHTSGRRPGLPPSASPGLHSDCPNGPPGPPGKCAPVEPPP